jgi:hypothetical protein
MNRKIILIIAGFVSILAWQCSKTNDSISPLNLSLKASLNAGTQKLNKAVSEIAQTRGYQIITLNDQSLTKSASLLSTGFMDSITLAKIAGIYEYHPITYKGWCFSCFSRLFRKTGESNELIVKLPDVKVFHPYRFLTVTPADSTLKNNFVITASDYHLYFSNGLLYDYKLAAGLAISDTAIGNLDIQSSSSSRTSFQYSSDFAFANGYNIKANVTSDDTIKTSYSLSSPSETLLKESVNITKSTGMRFRDIQYTLDIGNVEFIRTSGSDSIMVFVSGVLQKNAKITVIDKTNNTSTVSICRNRDIQITFDDGTTTTISQLISPSLTILSNMTSSMQNLFFASNLVDYIAWNIFKNRIN